MGKNQERKVLEGKKINGRKASAERYIPFYEFLLYDPIYREMKDKAKILYTFLRKKTIYCEEKTEAFESGEEGTRSYRDENGYIFCIADNSELSIILQCHPNRVKDQRDELERYGLLRIELQDKAAHRLYVLDPSEITERWTYIEEMKQLREKAKQENKAKAEKAKQKKKESQKSSDDKDSKSNQQSVSQPNQQNVSQSNQQNVGKTYLKDFKSTLNPLNINLNLSISEDIEKSSLPIALQKTLINKIDRLIEFDIIISDVETHFEAVKESFIEPEYNEVLKNLLNIINEQPRNFSAVMNDWLERNRRKQNNVPEKKVNSRKPIRTEMIPEFMIEDQKKERDVNDGLKDLFYADRIKSPDIDFESWKVEKARKYNINLDDLVNLLKNVMEEIKTNINNKIVSRG
jgi:hypothetical protein